MVKDDSRARGSFLVKMVAIGIMPFVINGWINSYIYDKPLLYWSFEFLSWILLPAALFTLAWQRYGLRRDELGLTATIAGRTSVTRVLLAAVVLSPGAYFFYRFSRRLAQQLVPDAGYFSYVLQVLQQDSLPRPLVAAYFALSAGIVEELYFRALMYRISRYYSRPLPLYLTLSPLLFALIHWENGIDDMLYTGMIGLLFAWLYARWQNLWPLIAAHVFIDYVNFG